MRVFLAEYVCGGGMRRHEVDDIAPSMRAEGGAMLSALANDLAAIADLSIPIDRRICPRLPDCDLHNIQRVPSLWGQWVRVAQGCDAAIVIAPETDGILAKAICMLRAAGIDVLASSSDFLRAAGDKQLTARIFTDASVPHPATLVSNDAKSLQKLEAFQKFIVKPRDGCGTQQIHVFHSLEDALAAMSEDYVLQGFVIGKPVSIAAIVSARETVILPAVSQEIAPENCSYNGGCGPLTDDEQCRATALAQNALTAMPVAPRGFIGFDLVLGEEFHSDVVIEVNARLTTSYVGLRHMISGNLGARLLGQASGPVQCTVAGNSVRWTPTGQVWINDIAANVP